MNIFNFCGSGNSGGGGGGGLPQPMKVVDSSHGEQLIQADVPYTSLGSVLIQAPNMANPVFDSSINTVIHYTPAEDSSGNPYFAMDSVTILAPTMETRTIDASSGALTINRDTENYIGLEQVNINAPVMETRTIDASYGSLTVVRDIENYVGLEQVNINAPVMKSITINPSKDSSTVYNIVSEGDVTAGYVGLEQVTVPVVTATIDSNITPENIKSGVTIIGVTGIYNQDFEYTTLYNRLVTI
jgi:hypothetical protein